MRSFGELRSVKIRACDKLKSLFSFSSIKCLPHLREMEVESCKNMEAVVDEGSDDDYFNNEVIEFIQLSSLKLKYLPNLRGFCKRKEGTPPTELLFNEMVSFPNLTSLEVYNCKSLKYVFTVSMVKYLMELKKLHISFCESLEEIIQSKKDKEIEQESINSVVFPNLDYLQLEYLPNVKMFSCGYSIEFPLLRELRMRSCSSTKNFVSKLSSDESDEEYLFNEMVTFSNLETMEVGDMNFKYLWDEQLTADGDSFSKLKSLHIYSCSKLSVVFPSNACRRFQRVETLYLSNCDEVKEIYEHQGIDFKEINNVESFSLRDLQIRNLHLLKNIWSNDPCRAFAFGNLQWVDVSDCNDLKYVFPASIASGLLHLQQLMIENCNNVEVIIAKGKDERSDPFFQFPGLKKLELVRLKEIRSLYEGRGSNIFVGKFIPNLEELTIDDQCFNAIHQSGEFCAKLKKFTMRYLKEVSSIPIVFGFLRRLKSLEMLVFKSCSVEEIFFQLDEHQTPIGEEQLHHLISLKDLKFDSIEELKHITRKKDSQLNRILQRLHTLDIIFCHDLINIAPSSSSFQNLTTLIVHCCGNMMNLVTTLTAKTMVQLVEMKVVGCTMIEEIVTRDGHDTDVIIFNKLKRLELDDLPEFNSFCSKNHPFNFPLLEQVTIKGCSRMKIFCGGDLSTPKLRGILFEDEQQWEGDLNATIASQLRDWVGEHLEEGRVFQNLESLEVAEDAFCSNAILANQMHFLNKLRKITVRDCESVRVVFDLEGLSAEDRYVGLLSQLYQIQLTNLPLLTQLCNKSPTVILDFNKLEVLMIENCSRLQYVFTWSMASCLFKLKRLIVKNCEMMETMIKKEEAEDAAQVILGSLDYIEVECLPKFSSIYSGSRDLECPSLKVIILRECPAIKSFVSRLIREDGDGKEEHNLIQFSHKVFPKLVFLSLDIKSITAILQIELPANFFSKVNALQLLYCYATTNSHVHLLHFLSRLPNVVRLGVCNSSFEELFRFEGLSGNVEEAAITLPQIRALELTNLDGLKRIWWWNSLLHTSVFQYLDTLEVFYCGNLINLASSSASFQNLTTLRVRGCNQLRNLITSSVAKSMFQLQTLTVQSCKMLMEIVEGINDVIREEIVFSKMKTLELDDLQSLRSFSSGHCNFKFPYLEQVVVHNCPNMRFFCPGNISTPMLNYVKDSLTWGDSHWEGNLNNTIEQISEKMPAQTSSSLQISMPYKLLLREV